MHPSVVAVAVLALVPVGADRPASLAAETCHGVIATIVGSPGASLTGTSGPDVVVTNGAATVDTGDGDDLVCSTATPPDGASIVLGDGDDAFWGGRGRESVDARDEGHDLVSTGGGYDSVTTGGDTAADEDVVDTGASGDMIAVNGLIGQGASLSGGEGHDLLSAVVPSPGRWVFDSRGGEVRHDGVTEWRFTGVEEFQLGQIHAIGRISFVGGPGDDLLIAQTSAFAGARLGGGNDTLYLGSPRVRRPVGVNGGTGRDRFWLMPHGLERPVPRAELDLGAGSLTYVDRSGRRSELTVEGFESADVHAASARVTGSAGRDVLSAWSCDVVLSGRGGNDWLGLLPDDPCGPRSERLLVGGSGDDRLSGSGYPDTLLGGPGHDRADGWDGRDRCQAEVQRGCELTVP